MFKFIKKNKTKFYSVLSFYIFFFIIRYIYKTFNKQKGLLLYLGANHGNSLVRIFYKFKRVIAIEANPALCVILKKKFKKKIEIYNYAVGEKNKKTYLNIYDQDSTNASINVLKNKKINKKIKINEINLSSFLKKKKIKKIDYYISDLEGMDYTVLRSIKNYLILKNVEFIQHECTIDSLSGPYKKKSNNEKLFKNILSKNYKKIGSGFGLLKPGMHNLPKGYRFKDILWKKK
jgi:FkbM family methyltransferase